MYSGERLRILHDLSFAPKTVSRLSTIQASMSTNAIDPHQPFAERRHPEENTSRKSRLRQRDMTQFQPDGWHTVTPRIVVRDPENLIEFIRTVFRAQGEFRAGLPAEIRIGDSVVMISGADGLRDPMPAFLYVYVEDADSTYRRAIAANAISLEVPADMPYGDRRAMVTDPWGNTWQIATHQRNLPVDEIRSRMANDG
ncbi:VOC family protein [Burkholderia diffusa]|uniref:VOC family protein n=1 Tax=Burkholderia diffusa TaxID=488732 RepID=UPI0020C6182F|nr:VOC family protein [Burkholderia diffusa]